MAKLRRKFSLGIRLKGSTDATTLEGEMRLDPSALKFKAYVDGAERSLVTEDQSQTIINKSINADNNTISNLETDNLKSGVLVTDISAATADTELPSALAVKTALAGQNEASEINYDNSTSGLTATDVQAAVDEVEGRLDTAESDIVTAQATADDHIADTVDAHDASAISNVASGNLAATNVQDALDELQTDVDTRALDSDLTAHITDTTDAHDASAVSYDNATSGLTATDSQAAIDEVEGRLDTAESDITTNASNLSSHTGASSGVHGVTGDVVGTSDTQTLTNKTVTGGVVDFTTASSSNKLVIPSDTKANLDLLTRDEGAVYWATDEDRIYGDDGTNLVLPQASATFTTVTKSANATLSTSSEDFVLVDCTSGDITLTLPTASGNNGLNYTITKTDSSSNHVIIDGNSTETIDGKTTIELYGQYNKVRIASDGTSWYTIGDPLPQTTIVKDIKTPNTAGGTFTSGSWQTRDLNTIENDIGFVSLSSNVITLQKGKYKIEAEAPAYQVDRHKIKLVRDPAGTPSDEEIGTSEVSSSADDSSTKSQLKCIVDVTTSTDFEIQHRCQTTNTTNGLGLESNFSVDEFYTIVTITRIS